MSTNRYLQPQPQPETSGPSRDERAPLLRNANDEYEVTARRKRRGIIAGILTFLFIAGLIVVTFVFTDTLSKDPIKAAKQILRRAPIIDGHIDLPAQARRIYRNNVTAIDLESPMPMHVDIPRLREGYVGAFFWSVYVDCADEGRDFLVPSNRVRDTLEQIDVAKLLIDKYPNTFEFATSTDDIRLAIREGKIASLLGVEGGHQLGNSLQVLRQYYALGVRYVTLTHSCNNAFADSCGIFEGPKPIHGGLSPLGRSLILEMNRLGVLVDLSHTSDDTAIQALKLTQAPVIWSHSSARAVHDVPRNVPDRVLKLIGKGENQTDAVVMVNFATIFVANPGNATVEAVADHVEHIAKVAGKEHVGLGSDFDGIEEAPVGLEDVSKYPALIAVLRERGWSRQDLAGLAGANFLRVFQAAEAVSWRLQHSGAKPSMDYYRKRKDLPKKIPGNYYISNDEL